MNTSVLEGIFITLLILASLAIIGLAIHVVRRLLTSHRDLFPASPEVGSGSSER